MNKEVRAILVAALNDMEAGLYYTGLEKMRNALAIPDEDPKLDERVVTLDRLGSEYERGVLRLKESLANLKEDEPEPTPVEEPSEESEDPDDSWSESSSSEEYETESSDEESSDG